MIHLNEEELRRLQLAELELLKEFDRICRKNGIPYNIIAGTLLGAHRHGGFIPWDDDVDVALLRKDYERFIETGLKDLDQTRFEFQDHNNTKGYRWGYGKLRLKDTLFLREHQEDMPYFQGIFMDVFPLDCVPENRLLRTIRNFECFCLRKCLWARVGKKADPDPFKRKIYGLLDRIPEETLKNRLNKLIGKAKKTDSSWVRILMFPTPNKEYGYRKKWYEESTETTFEGLSFPGIREYDDYLTFKFGNWHELPPVDKRKVHPVSRIKLP